MDNDSIQLAVETVKSPSNEGETALNTNETPYNPLHADIFNWPTFPTAPGKLPHKLTPNDVKSMLNTYSSTNYTIVAICKDMQVTLPDLLNLIQFYPALSEAYTYAKHCKARIYNDEALRYYGEKPPDFAYEETSIGSEVDDEGNRTSIVKSKLSSAAVSWIDKRANAMKAQAVLHDRLEYGDVQRIESKSLSVSAHYEVPTESRALADAIEDLLQ